MSKLTANQLATLRKIAAGEVEQRNYGYGAWRIVGASPTVVGRLINTLKLACWGALSHERMPCELTPAGVAALAQAEGREQ